MHSGFQQRRSFYYLDFVTAENNKVLCDNLYDGWGWYFYWNTYLLEQNIFPTKINTDILKTHKQ